ncbi:MAG: response regulator transcription factor [Verrucomicrobiales bacterium]|nr:response regulator transcription factor [Verrucomicrobiota bacterium JB025]
MRCLLIEDYGPLRESIQEYLRGQHYVVDSSETGDEGLWYAENHEYDVIVLDIMLPKMDGLQIVRRLRERQERKVPVIIVSARDTVEHRVEGLDAGADDYLVKPFALSELAARVRALTRRGYGSHSPRITVGPIEIDRPGKSVRCGDEALALTPREYTLLEYLAMRAGETVSRTDIWDHVYEDSSGGSSNNVDVYVGYLRKKLAAHGCKSLLQTIRGFGYRLSADSFTEPEAEPE